jgi:hypothetical protein
MFTVRDLLGFIALVAVVGGLIGVGCEHCAGYAHRHVTIGFSK